MDDELQKRSYYLSLGKNNTKKYMNEDDEDGMLSTFNIFMIHDYFQYFQHFHVS
jgi:hypothetical protein